MFRYLRKTIKQRLKPSHPHVHLLKHAKTSAGRGCGRWRAVGRKPFSGNLRFTYGRTMREAYEKYMEVFYCGGLTK